MSSGPLKITTQQDDIVWTLGAIDCLSGTNGVPLVLVSPARSTGRVYLDSQTYGGKFAGGHREYKHHRVWCGIILTGEITATGLVNVPPRFCPNTANGNQAVVDVEADIEFFREGGYSETKVNFPSPNAANAYVDNPPFQANPAGCAFIRPTGIASYDFTFSGFQTTNQAAGGSSGNIIVQPFTSGNGKLSVQNLNATTFTYPVDGATQYQGGVDGLALTVDMVANKIGTIRNAGFFIPLGNPVMLDIPAQYIVAKFGKLTAGGKFVWGNFSAAVDWVTMNCWFAIQSWR